MAHQSQPAPPVTNERPEVPESLTKILDKTLAKKREDRYQTGRELADALTAWLFENAPHEWKEKHLPMYAALRLQDLLSNPQKTTQAEPVNEAVDETNVKTPAAAMPTKPAATPKPPTALRPNASETTKSIASKTTKLGSLAKSRAKIQEPQGLVEIARQHPAAAVVVSVLATAVLIAAGIYFLRPPQPASANDRSQATIKSPQTAQAEFAKAK